MDTVECFPVVKAAGVMKLTTLPHLNAEVKQGTVIPPFLFTLSQHGRSAGTRTLLLPGHYISSVERVLILPLYDLEIQETCI